MEGRADVVASSSSTGTTVESAGLRDGDILLLEEGAPPIKGSSVLKVNYLPPALSANVFMRDSNLPWQVFVWQPLNYSTAVVETATPSEGENDSASLSAPAGSNSQRLERLEALVGRRQRCLLPLVDIVAAASDSLDELYQRVYEAIVKLPGITVLAFCSSII